MLEAIQTSATGLQAQQGWIDATANNLANLNTTGFKRDVVDFADLLYLTLQQPGTFVAEGVRDPTGTQIGLGTLITSTAKVFTQGAVESTDRTLDVAIEGNGFLQVVLPDGGIRYTRDGSLALNAAGVLTTADGLIVQPPITIPANATAVSIGTDGTVTAILPDQTNPQTLGQLTLTNFRNPAGLSSEGNNLYAVTAASGLPVVSVPGQNGTGLLRQGFLERSNVEAVRELTNLILAQQAYTFNAEAIRTANEMLRTTTDLLG